MVSRVIGFVAATLALAALAGYPAVACGWISGKKL